MHLSGTDKKSIVKRKPKLLYIGAYRPSPGWMRSTHTHGCLELTFVKEGSGFIRIGDSDCPFQRGNLIVLNPLVPHTEYVRDGEQCDLVFLGISRLCVDGYNKNSLVKKGDYAITETGEYYESLRQLFELLIAENVQKPDYFTQISDSVLSIVISLVLRLTTAEQEKEESNKTYDEVKNYIDDNFTSIDTIDDVCQNLYVNKYYLTHLFKDTIGVPPLRYLIQKRIDYAKTLLKSTNKPISVVAKECGYTDSAYFCRVFKKVTSVSPKAYRDINFKKE